MRRSARRPAGHFYYTGETAHPWRIGRGRYGEAIRADPARAAQSRAFLAWAAGYDDSSSGGSRTLATHTSWLSRFTCPVLALRGALTVAERVARAQVTARVAARAGLIAQGLRLPHEQPWLPHLN